MKRIVSFLCLCFALAFSSAQSLPDGASHFINTFFPNNQMNGIAEYNDGSFVVQMDMDISIQFDNSGACLYVISMHQDISHLVSDKIKSYLRENGDNPSTIGRLQFNWQGDKTRVTLTDGAIFVFDTNGNFIRRDQD